MKTFTLILRVGSLVFFAVAALHLFLGLEADVLLGAKLPEAVIQDPALDSQNRFYGVAFSLYGVLLLVCATNIRQYATVLRCVLWVFLAAGAARLVSIALYGVPPAPVLALLAVELVLPPLLLVWLYKLEREG